MNYISISILFVSGRRKVDSSDELQLKKFGQKLSVSLSQ